MVLDGFLELVVAAELINVTRLDDSKLKQLICKLLLISFTDLDPCRPNALIRCRPRRVLAAAHTRRGR